MKAEQTDPRMQRAIDVIVRIQRLDRLPEGTVEAFMPQLVKDAGLLLATIDGPAPDWADLREMARNAGYRISRTAKRRRNDRRVWLWYALDGDEPVGEFQRTAWATQVHLRGPKGYTALLEFTAADVAECAHRVGLGVSRDVAS